MSSVRKSGFAGVLAIVLLAGGDPAAPYRTIATPSGPVRATIVLDPQRTYQTISGWRATAFANQESPSFDVYKSGLFEDAVGDLGLTGVQLTVMSGAEHTRDTTHEYQSGVLSYADWRAIRYTTVNDNDDPFTINWDGFHFSDIDRKIDRVINPMRERMAARGEKLSVEMAYVAFIEQSGPGAGYVHTDPEEYAEFVLACYQHLQNKYGWVPDALEVILEPDNTLHWSPSDVGRAVAVAGRRLEAAGFHPAIIAPSTLSMARGLLYFEQLIRVPGAREHITEFGYHRYSGTWDAALWLIGKRTEYYGVATAMLECQFCDYEDLHKDLTIGRNSTWDLYGLLDYYQIDLKDAAHPVSLKPRARFLRQYFKFIRPGAVRIAADSTTRVFSPVAFLNRSGAYVVVIKADAGGRFTVAGLPPGAYGLKYTTAHDYNVDLPGVTVTEGAGLTTAIPEKGVLTIYAASAPVTGPAN